MQRDELLDYIHNIFLVKQHVDQLVGQANGVSPLDVHILTFLKMHADDPTAAGIEHKHRIKKNTISVHVENLVRQGYLLRQYKADDRRKVILSLSDKGEEIVRQGFIKCGEMGRKLREGLTEDDVATMYRCFGIVNSNALKILDRSHSED